MNRMPRLLTLAATCACSISLLSDFAMAQGQPQPQGGGAGGDAGARGRQPGNRGNNNGGDQGGRGQRGGGGGGFGGGMFGGGRGMFEPSVTTEEMDRYGKTLNLTKAQSDAVKSLHDAYVQDFDAAAQKARDEMDAIREEGGDNRFQEMGDLFTKFRAKRTAMETSFFNDVKATLTPEQQQMWPTIEKTRRRETTMNRGLMSGERVDLVKIVDGLKLPTTDHKPVEPILDQYQIDLDRELILRNEQQDKFQGNMRDLFTGGGDQTKMQKMIEDGRAASIKLRDVNKRYARQVEAALPESVRAKFNEEVKHESFPNIYRGGSYATRVIDAASGMTELTAEQKTSLGEIKDRYTRDMGALNQKMETAYEQRESTITAAEIMARFGGGQGGGGGGPRGGGPGGMIDSEELSTLRDQRRDLDNATVEKVQALLNEEQKAKLPQQRGGRGDRGGDAGGGGGGGGGNGGNGGGNGGGRRNRPNNNQPAPNGRT